MTTVLVIGGTGLLGDELVRQAVADPNIAQVLATWRETSREAAPDIEHAHWHQLDITDASAVDALLTKTNPDVVINTAYVKGGPLLDAVTGQAPRHVAEACRRSGARMVQISSDIVFDGTSKTPYHEASPVNPINDYGKAKQRAETDVLALGSLVARSSIIYGGHRPEPQVALLEEAAAGGDIAFFTDEVRNPIHVTDLASAILEYAALDDPPPILHLAGSDAVDRLTFARLLGAAHGIDVTQLRGAPAPTDSGRPKHVPTDISLAQHRLTTRLRGVYECLETTPPG